MTAWRLFEFAFRPWMRRRIRVHVAGSRVQLEPGFPLVLVANHESWWDGFLLREVQKALRPGARFRTVMLESELRAHPFLRLLGGVGVAPGSMASGRRLLDELRRIRREDPDGVLGYFPQGSLQPGSALPLGFRSGIVRVVEALAPATVVPVGLRLLPGKTPLTEAYLSLGDPLAVPGPGAASLARIESAVADEVEAIASFVRTHGEDTAALWPGPGGRLPRPADTPSLLHDVGSWISRN